MKVLLFLDPAWNADGFLRATAPIGELVTALARQEPGTPFSLAVCSPGSSSPDGQSFPGGADATAITRVGAMAGAYMQSIKPLLAPTTEPKADRRRIEYARGQGEAAGRLGDLFAAVREKEFAFDLVLAPGEGAAPPLAAERAGARFARLTHWPPTGSRWRSFGFIECRDTSGRSVLDTLSVHHLRHAALPCLPSAIDQRLLGPQREVNPWEAAFAPPRGAEARMLSTDHRLALLAFGGDAAIAGKAADPGEAGTEGPVEAAGLRLLADGWRIIVFERPESGEGIGAKWKKRDGVVVLPEASFSPTKRGRRALLSLLAQVDLVVTVGAGLGLEAALYDRPVCVLGRPFYAPEGLFPDLARATAEDFDRQAYGQDLARLRDLLFRCWGVRWSELASARGMMERLAALSELNERYAGNPTGWIEGAMERFGSEAERETMRELTDRESELEPIR